MKNSLTGSRELPLCDRTDFSDGSTVWSTTSFRNMQTEPVAVEVCEIFTSYWLRRFHKRTGANYDDISCCAHDKNVELEYF